MILTLRTDKPEAEIGLFDGDNKLAYETWLAHRQLAESLHKKIRELLDDQNKNLKDVTGIVVYKGPGSFTGLRIGLSVANAMAYALEVPVASMTGEDWVNSGIEILASGGGSDIALPEYGAPVNITKPRK